MNRRLHSTTIAACYALTAFAIAIISGVSASSPASDVLADAILALMLCYFVALVAAKVFQVVLDEYQRSIQAAVQTVELEQSPDHIHENA